MITDISVEEELAILRAAREDPDRLWDAIGYWVGYYEDRREVICELILRTGLRKLGRPSPKQIAILPVIRDHNKLYAILDRIPEVNTWEELFAPLAPEIPADR
jgi:hypothetical protein